MLAEQCSNVLQSQYNHKLHLAKYSNCNIHLSYNINMIIIIILYNILTIMILGIPKIWKGIYLFNQLKPNVVFQVLFVDCSFPILHLGLSHICNLP